MKGSWERRSDVQSGFYSIVYDGDLSQRVCVFDIQCFRSVITPVVLNHISI